MRPDTVQLRPHFPLAEEIIDAFASELGGDLVAYRNHVRRVLNFHLALSGQASPTTATLIAAAFHDLGIWTHGTFDYLPPSLDLATAYLATHGLGALEVEVRTIIAEHHKLLPYKNPAAASVEVFRKADLVDLSLGAIRFGLPSAFAQAVRATFPNAGFHRLLTRLALRQFAKSPLRPLPMVHW